MSKHISFGLRVVVGVLVPLAGAGLACDSAGDTEREASGGSRAEASAGGSTSGGAESGGSTGSGGRRSSNSGGVATSGGQASGRASGGMGGESAGGGAAVPCEGKCQPGTVCDERSDKCVPGCVSHPDCADPARPMCTLEGRCEACIDDFSCKDTLGLGERSVCLDGVRDLKTGEVRPNTGACAECGASPDCGGDICDPTTLTCVPGLKYRVKSVCKSCENDLECVEGHYCIPRTFLREFVGNYCAPTKASRVGPEGSCDREGAPFTDTVEMTSVGGYRALFCVLGMTTCPGFLDFGKSKPGCQGDDEEADEACGIEGVDDGLCRISPFDGEFHCTYGCSRDNECGIFANEIECDRSSEESSCIL